MKQSRLESFLEAKLNTIVGLIVSFLLGMIVYPLYGFQVTASQNLSIMAIFTVASVIRSYTIRRIFNKRTHGG